MTTQTGSTRAYRRISLDTAASGSIAKQAERLTAYEVSKGRSPKDIVWYTDESVSGSKVAFSDRDAGGKLWNEIQRGDRVIITKIDRAARNVADLLALVKHIDSLGATVTFIDNDIDTSTSSGRLVLTILGAIAEFEASLISERRKESLASFATEGRHVLGSAPFGLVSVPNPAGRGLVIAPDYSVQVPFLLSPAEMVREAVARIIAGESQTIVRESLGIPLSPSGFNRLLRNPRLAGMTPAGDSVYMVDGSPRIQPDSALISLTEWDALTAIVGAGDKAWSKAEGFGKALRCGTCGDRLYLNLAKNGHHVYRCRKVNHKAGEAGLSIAVANADKHVASTFLKRFGAQKHWITATVNESAAKTEALSIAKIKIADIQRRMSAVSDPAEIMELAQALAAAQTERIAAEALPTEMIVKRVPTGKTVAEEWQTMSDDERCTLIARHGYFTVAPGRVPLAEKITFTAERAIWRGLAG